MLFGIVLLLAGCEEEVLPPDPHAYPYSMWGVLDALNDTQFVRVFPLETSLTPGLPEPLDARFTSLDLGTGEEYTWCDSVFVDAQERVGHVFYAPFQAEWEHRYRVEITGDDGRASWAEVEMPPRSLLYLNEPDTIQGVLLSAFIQGDPEHLVKASLVFTLLGGGQFIRHEVPFDTTGFRREDGWEFKVNLNQAYIPLRDTVSALLGQDIQSLALCLLEFTAVIGSEEWQPPDGVFDPNVLVQPGAMENVENGFGFVTGGYKMSRPWTLLFSVVERAGFRRCIF